jgi:diguanylate cyclase (GGDEF)-like protein/PAS domain S-box-containing protein
MTPPVPMEHWVTELGTLLEELENMTAAGWQAPPLACESAESQLVGLRLGVVSSLFAALQCKHAATAGHSLRVALTCSAWARKLDLEESQRDLLEIAALLHDIGVIGVPDHILLKPGALDCEEAAVMHRSRAMSLEILHSCAAPEILSIVENVRVWYDGPCQDETLRGEDIPLPARMIAVVEAFDAMTTDHLYRPALSEERATAELFHCAGKQFDPNLVRQFAEFRESDLRELRCEVAGHWLGTLDPEMVNSYWEHNCVPSPPLSSSVDGAFHARLLDNMYDAVVFIDAAGKIMLWNHGAERLTGIAGTSVCQRRWGPQVLNMADEKGQAVAEADCPVLGALQSGVQSLRRLAIGGRMGRRVSVDTHAIPVFGAHGAIHGAILLLHDASSETSLEQRCQSLHEKATLDPLTQVANRAEFDRVHEMFVEAHQQQQVPCSLLMCDMDHFKSVNDTYGHQAGDEAIKSVTILLKGACRPGDLVARYGGEEFVMLCADCDNAAAARRAEQVRMTLAQMPQPKMGGRPVTVSFGVTEIQPGDTAETMLRRADRALLLAKAKGRNTVVQLGTGGCETSLEVPRAGRPDAPAESAQLVEQTLWTPVPLQIAIEKLRGFVADHGATILKIDGNQVQLEIAEKGPGRLRRLTDRAMSFQVNLRFEEQRLRKEESGHVGHQIRTKIYVSINPCKDRDRRRSDVRHRARQMLTSFRAYLMATAEEDLGASPRGTWVRAKRILAPWLAWKK